MTKNKNPVGSSDEQVRALLETLGHMRDMKRRGAFRILVFKRPRIRIEFHAPYSTLFKNIVGTELADL